MAQDAPRMVSERPMVSEQQPDDSGLVLKVKQLKPLLKRDSLVLKRDSLELCDFASNFV